MNRGLRLIEGGEAGSPIFTLAKENELSAPNFRAFHKRSRLLEERVTDSLNRLSENQKILFGAVTELDQAVLSLRDNQAVKEPKEEPEKASTEAQTDGQEPDWGEAKTDEVKAEPGENSGTQISPLSPNTSPPNGPNFGDNGMMTDDESFYSQYNNFGRNNEPSDDGGETPTGEHAPRNEEPGDVFINMMESRNLITPFTGEADSQIFDDFILRARDLIELHKDQSEEEKVKRLRVFLDGPARRFFEAIEDSRKRTLEDAISALREKYMNNWRQDVMQQRLEAMFQEPNEPVATFANRLRKAVRAAYYGKTDNELDEIAFKYFKNRVQKGLAVFIKLQNARTMAEAEKTATELEAFFESQKMRDSSEITPQLQSLFQTFQDMSINSQGPSYRNGPQYSGRFRDRSQSRDRSFRRYSDDYSRRRERTPSRDRNYRDRGEGYRRRRDNSYNRRYERDDSQGRAYDRNRRSYDRRDRSYNQRGERSQSRESEKRVSFRDRPSTPYESKISSLETELAEARELLRKQEAQTVGYKKIVDDFRRVEEGRTSHSSRGNINTISLLSTLTLVMLMSLPLSMATEAMFCNKNGHPVLFQMPHSLPCPIVHDPPNATFVSLKLYGKAPLKQALNASMCRIYTTTVRKYTNIFGVTFYEKPAIEEHVVSLRQCSDMRVHKICEFGTLVEKEDVMETENAVDMSPPYPVFGSFAWTIVSSTNCQVYQTSMIYNRELDRVTSPTEQTDDCAIERETCQAKSGSLFVWQRNTPIACLFRELGTYNGTYDENGRFVTSDSQWALSFSDKPESVIDCNLTMVLSMEDIAITEADYIIFKNLSKEAMLEAAHMRHAWSLIRVAGSGGVSSAINALDSRLTFKISHTLAIICQGLDFMQNSLRLATAKETTLAARQLLNYTYLEAFAVSDNVFGVIFCEPLARDNVKLKPAHLRDSFLPVSILVENRWIDMFVDIHTGVVTADPKESLFFPIIYFHGQYLHIPAEGLLGAKVEWTPIPVEPLQLAPVVNLTRATVEALMRPTHVKNSAMYDNITDDTEEVIEEAIRRHITDYKPYSGDDFFRPTTDKSTLFWFLSWPTRDYFFLVCSILSILQLAYSVLFAYLARLGRDIFGIIQPRWPNFNLQPFRFFRRTEETMDEERPTPVPRQFGLGIPRIRLSSADSARAASDSHGEDQQHTNNSAH